MNDIQPVLYDTDYYKKGDVFVSLKHLNFIFLYRPSTHELVWSKSAFDTNYLKQQHDIDILDNTRIAFFNNNVLYNHKEESFVNDHNEVIIYDFATDSFSRYLPEALKQHEVRTITQGSSEIMPDGDLFIEETNYGRLLYFNASGELQWSYINRVDNGEIYPVSWSRILYKLEDIKQIQRLLSAQECYNE